MAMGCYGLQDYVVDLEDPYTNEDLDLIQDVIGRFKRRKSNLLRPLGTIIIPTYFTM
jgi:hypothetical protein